MRQAQTKTLPAPGQRIHSACGPSQHSDGIALAHVTNDFGTYALVLMDDGSTESCHSLSTGPGIGWHTGPSPTKEWMRRNVKKAH
ncbi:MAG: hypothetical protein RR800_00530 [Comamonas sp.]